MDEGGTGVGAWNFLTRKLDEAEECLRCVWTTEVWPAQEVHLLQRARLVTLSNAKMLHAGKTTKHVGDTTMQQINAK